MIHIDIVIVGGGPAGLAAAIAAKERGAGFSTNASITALDFIPLKRN